MRKDERPYYSDNFFPHLNADQRKIMSSCASMATSNPNTAQVAIVQGPPGMYVLFLIKKSFFLGVIFELFKK